MQKALIIAILILNGGKVYAPSVKQKYEAEIDQYKEFHIEYQYTKKIELILETIRWIESRNNYHIKGGSREYGAYQFTPSTWRDHCKLFFGRQLNIKSPANQDVIAQMKIERLIDKGYELDEIASIWNSGSPKWKGKIGVNRYSVQYNVPRYVRKFMNEYKN